MVMIAIDPGQTGAIAAYDGARIIGVIDMPVSARLYGKGKQVDAYTLATDIIGLCDGEPSVALVEAVSAMPGQGASSMFRFGESAGIVLGVLGALQIPVRFVLPQVWKRRAGLLKKEKDAARTLAIHLHPEVADKLARKKDVGRADAICIARFG